jgi:hypothetical protein
VVLEYSSATSFQHKQEKRMYEEQNILISSCKILASHKGARMCNRSVLLIFVFAISFDKGIQNPLTVLSSFTQKPAMTPDDCLKQTQDNSVTL